MVLGQDLTTLVRWYTDPLRTIPTVGGPALPGLSYVTAWRTLRNGRGTLEEGYRKYPGSVFKLALPDRWLVVFSGPKLVEEIRKHPEAELSSVYGNAEQTQAKYTLEPQITSDRYHVHASREKLARKLPTIFPDLLDEVAIAVEEHLATKTNDSEWTGVEVLPLMHNIVPRVTSRVFVGLPLCRSEEYLSRAVGFAHHLPNNAAALRLVPDFIKPVIAPFIVKTKYDTSHVVTQLRPIVEERMKASAELDDGQKGTLKPNDMLQSLLDSGIPKGESLFVIAQRLLMLNLAAFHTSSITVTHVLYHLAEKPDLLQSLRDEIQSAVSVDGWTFIAIKKMWKLDSIFREVLRYHGILFLTVTRKAMKDITLDDGTRIPKGTLLQAATLPQLRDDAYLENAGTFNPFRFARMRSVEGESVKHQSTNTSPEYIPFGHGKHACPGRYFAAGELKAILAYIILNYDMKLGGDGSRPANVDVGMAVVPAPHGCVLFRKREGSM